MSEESLQASQNNEFKNPNQQPQQDEPGLWIASFVLSLWWMNILALIFWIISLNQKNNRRTAKTWVIIASVRLWLRIILAIFIWIFLVHAIYNTQISDNVSNIIYYETNNEEVTYPNISDSKIGIDTFKNNLPETETNETALEQINID